MATVGVELPDLMTMDELIKRLGLGQTKTYELQKLNELPFPVVRIGGRVMVSRRAYHAWLSQYDFQGEEPYGNQDVQEP